MTDGEPETIVSASLQKIKSIKNPIFLFFYFIKSETSDSFVYHFGGHFAYLKTWDFYFKDEKRDTLSVTCSDDEFLKDVDADAVVRPLATVVEN